MMNQLPLVLSSVAIILATGMVNVVNGQTPGQCFTKPQWVNYCVGELKLDSDGDSRASSEEYVAMLDNTAKTYGIENRTTEDPPTLFYKLEISLQLPFVAYFCDALVALKGGELGKCYETLESEAQTNEVFGFPLSETNEADEYLTNLCTDIYLPAVERQWIAACGEEEKEELPPSTTVKVGGGDGDRDGGLNIGPTFIAIGASGPALLLFLAGLGYALYKDDDDDEDKFDFENAVPFDANGKDIEKGVSMDAESKMDENNQEDLENAAPMDDTQDEEAPLESQPEEPRTTADNAVHVEDLHKDDDDDEDKHDFEIAVSFGANGKDTEKGVSMSAESKMDDNNQEEFENAAPMDDTQDEDAPLESQPEEPCTTADNAVHVEELGEP
jgi:hypothetical protein